MKINNHWSKYWETGAQTSLPNDFKNNYDGEIYDFWRERVSDLKTGDKVLDICTGNGAVALLISEIAIQQNKNIQITAVDISEINTDFIKQKNNHDIVSQIKFISHCPVSKLEHLKTEPQQLIVSQYGLEYTDLSETADVIFNLIVPNGELAFIAHSADSDVFNYMQIEQAIYQWLSDINILKILESFIKYQCSVNSFKNKLMLAVQSNQPPNEFYGQPLLISWQKTLTVLLKGDNQFVKQQRTQLSEFLEEHQAAWLRAKDMVAVGHKLKDKDWTDAIINTGFSQIDKQTILYKNKHLAGYGYRFKKQKN